MPVKETQPAAVEDGLGLIDGAAVAVEDQARQRRGEFVEDGDRLGEGVAAVDDDGQAAFGGEGQLGAEDLDLTVFCGKVVVEIQAGLADGDDLVFAGLIGQEGQIVVGGLGGVVRVDADGGVHSLKAGGQVDGLAVVLGVGADGDPAGHARGAAAVEDGLDGVGVVGVGQVGMGVDEIHFQISDFQLVSIMHERHKRF